MPFMPFNILGIWFRGLLAIAIIVGGIYLIKLWYNKCQVVLPVRVVSTTEAPDRAPRPIRRTGGRIR
jgi:hypothetical protein